MESARLFWSKMKWGLLLVLVVLVATFGILQGIHRSDFREGHPKTGFPRSMLPGLSPSVRQIPGSSQTNRLFPFRSAATCVRILFKSSSGTRS